MDLTSVYAKGIGCRFKKLKIIGAIVFVVGCLINPILNDLAFFLAGSSIGFLGLLLGVEKTMKRSLFEANRIEMENDNIHIFVEDKELEIIVNKNSPFLMKHFFEGKNIFIFNSIVIGKVEQ